MLKFIKKEPEISYIGKPETKIEKRVQFCTVDRGEQIGGIDKSADTIVCVIDDS